MKLSAAITPPREDCEDTALPPGFVPAPPQFVEPGTELRLIQPLRDVAATGSARAIVARAAVAFYWQEHPSALPTQQGSTDLGNALADLAVTGRVAYASMSAEPPTEAALRPMVKTLLGPSVDASYTDVTRSINRALNRSYAVARALRGPRALRAARRAALGWIAVSGDDDSPHRPVNVPAPPFEQYEIPVTVRGVTARTRFLIASAVEPAATVATDPASHELPPDPRPEVPDGHRVILFLHGHSSAAEEALAIIPHIHSAGLAQGTRFSVISLDLPNNGYSETFAHTLVAPLADTSYPWKLTDKGPIRTPILDFIEDFVVAFVDALDEITPIKRRFAGVIGGSLGGNLGLRLGRRNLVASPWLEAGIVSWSAASVWDANVNDLVKSQAPKSCLDLCVAETEASRADYFQRVFFKDLHWTPGLGGTTGLNHPQPYFWYRDDWQPCKALHILGAHLARRETYNANFRQWHWRVAAEQLIYSHVDRVQHDDETTPYRYQLNRVRQLLVAGDQDNGTGANIYEATRTLAGLMVNTPGESLFLRETGHSIHAERPRFFGRTIVQFLSAVELPDRVAGVAAAVSLLLGEAPAPAAPAPAATYAAVSLLLS